MIENPKIRNVSEVMRDRMVLSEKILTILRNEPLNVPQLAEKLGYPVHEVVYWVMDMWRYGKVEETGEPDDEGYYQYQLKEELS